MGGVGAKEVDAKRAYRQFVKKGIDEGHRPDLVGGGLIRSQGGWSSVKALRRLAYVKNQMNGFWAEVNLLNNLSRNQIKREKGSFPLSSVYNVLQNILKKSVKKKR